MENIPQIGFGTYQLRGEIAENMVYQAIQIGYRHFDTAQLYRNEENVGKGIKRGMSDLGLAREDIWVTTKVWVSAMKNGRKGIVKSLVKSLVKLDLDYIDLVLLHVPLDNFIECWKVLEDVVLGLVPEIDSQSVRRIGVSNFGVVELEKLYKQGEEMRVKPYVNQIEVTPFCQKRELVGWCQEQQLIVTAHSSLTKGQRLEDDKLLLVARQVSQRLGRDVSSAQVLLAWALTQGYGILPRAEKVEHVQENWSAQEIKLTEDEISALCELEDGFLTHSRHK